MQPLLLSKSHLWEFACPRPNRTAFIFVCQVHNLEFICLLQNHLQGFRCFPPLDKIFEPSKLRQEAGAKDLRQVKTR